jgi:hypothetical protein
VPTVGVAWTPPAPQPPSSPSSPSAAGRAADVAPQIIRPSAVAPSEDEYVDGGFASEFDDDEFDDGPGGDDEFPPLDLAAQSGRHRKRRRRMDQPAIEIPAQPAAQAGHAARGRESIETPPPIDAFEDGDEFADAPEPAGKGKPAPAATPERPKAKQPRDEDDDDFDDDDDDDDFGDDDEEEDPAANSSSQLGASVTTAKNDAGGRKLPWVPIAAVAGGLVLVLAFAFRETLFGTSDEPDVADGSAETSTDGAEPAAEPEPEPEPKPQPEPVPEPKAPAIPVEELDAKIAEAKSLVNRQKYDDARVIIDEVLGKIPNEGRMLALLAQSHLEKNKLEDALGTANDCVAADAGQSFCWIVIATVEQGNDNLPRALEAYRKYIEVEPTGEHAKSAKKQITRLEGKVQG